MQHYNLLQKVKTTPQMNWGYLTSKTQYAEVKSTIAFTGSQSFSKKGLVLSANKKVLNPLDNSHANKGNLGLTEMHTPPLGTSTLLI